MHRIFLGTLIFLLVVNSNLLAQEPKSIHQIEWERHRNSPTSADLIGNTHEKIIPLNRSLHKAKGLNARVFGFLPYWSTSEYLRYDLLSHIAAFSVEVNANGSLGNDHGWPWVNLINKAHSRGVKVILTATLFDGDKIHTLITNETYKNNFFVNIKNKMLEGSADGLNVDFESLNNTDRGANINNFMAELTEYLHTQIPGCEVSFDGPAVNWGGYWDFAGLAQSCDYIFIMGYAFAGSWSKNSGPNAPLVGGSINITNTILSQYGFVTATQPEKLILGLPYYGHHWKTLTDQPGAATLGFVGSKFYDSAFSGSQTYGLLWHNPSQTPWYNWHDGSDFHQVWFDNDSSLSLKYDLAIENNYSGVGMWALGYDGNRQELWDAIDLKFGSGELPAPSMPLSLRVLNESATSLRIQFEPANRASGYFAYLSSDGISFPDSVFLATTDAVISDLNPEEICFVRVRAVNSTGLSSPTEVLAAIPSSESHRVLIVNGFDRTGGTNNSFDFIRQHGEAISQYGLSFSSASNEAVFKDGLSLDDYDIVDWILGDESTADDTFNQFEQVRLKTFLQNGGKLFVSGSEIGWDLQRGSTADASFYNDFLKAQYIADAPNGRSGTYYSTVPLNGTILEGLNPFSFDDGTHGTFDVDWPDAIKGINGGINCLTYSGVSTSSGVAGIYFNGLFPQSTIDGKLVHLAIPFETIYPEMARIAVMQKILDFFEGIATDVIDESVSTAPREFTLYQNYPNPFNPSTTISFYLPSPGEVSIEIFNTLGQRIKLYNVGFAYAGYQEWIWDGSDNLRQRVPTGTYIYRVSFSSQFGQQHLQERKMLIIH